MTTTGVGIEPTVEALCKEVEALRAKLASRNEVREIEIVFGRWLAGGLTLTEYRTLLLRALGGVIPDGVEIAGMTSVPTTLEPAPPKCTPGGPWCNGLQALFDADVPGGLRTAVVTHKQTGAVRHVVGHAYLDGKQPKMKVLSYCPICGSALTAAVPT